MSLASASALITANHDSMASRWRWRSVAVSAGAFGCGLLTFGISLAALEATYSHGVPERYSAWIFLDFLVGLICCALVGTMYSAGRGNLALIALASLSSLATPAGLIGVVRLGARRSRTDDALVLGVVSLSTLVHPYDASFFTSPLSWDALFGLPLTLAITYGFLLWGRSRGDQVRLMESLRTQALTAQRERDAVERERIAQERRRLADLARAQSQERTSIARDMHDTLSHHLSLIAMHAGAMAFRDDLTPEQMRTTARTVRDAAEAANSDLRTALSALRQDAVGAGKNTIPLPTFADVDAVMDTARERGHEVRAHFDGVTPEALTALPASTTASLHRIVTELVVNAEKYAPDAVLDLTFAHRGNQLIVQAINPTTGDAPGSTLGTGLGLVGLGERARLLGGQMTCTNDDSSFTVEVSIPWTR